MAVTMAAIWSESETARLANVRWWRNYRWQSLALLALTAWVVIAFR